MIKGQKYQLIFQPVLLSNVTIGDSFWLPRLETNRTVSLFHQYQQLLKYGALENFKRAAGEGSRNFTGLYFSDSDVYKWLEASSYSLKTHWDSRLKSIVDEVFLSSPRLRNLTAISIPIFNWWNLIRNLPI